MRLQPGCGEVVDHRRAMVVGPKAAELGPAVLEAFGRGDEDGFRAVYDRYAGPVYAVAMSVLRDADLAADAVQETFIRAWRAADRYDPRQAVAPWLFTIARRVAVDMWRARRRTAALPPDDAVVALPPELETVWAAFQVRAAVERLPPEERDIVRLHHFHQFSYAEIAAHVGVPLGTVKSRSHRAHGRLADWLRPVAGIDSEPAPAPDAYREYADPGAHRDDV